MNVRHHRAGMKHNSPDRNEKFVGTIRRV
jgi:hypothetical protein